jgi:molybdopterin/thiamine biosynthesis adenylyltransferase
MLPEDETRYSRQVKLPQIGEQGQQRIRDSHVLIIGMGGLGSPAALYLAGAGVGTLTLSDFDVVEVSNLQRQIIHRSDSAGMLKTTSAARSIHDLNPDCTVRTIDHEMDEDELKEAIGKADIVLDCSDNFPTRFSVNRLCVQLDTPLVSAAAIRLEGQIMSFIPGAHGPCYQCLYSDEYQDAQTCAMEGVLGPVVGVMGVMQALQALLILTDHGEALTGKLLLFDAMNMTWQQVKLPANPGCPVCGEK